MATNSVGDDSYVDWYGQPITVIQERGRILIPVSELEKRGLKIFKKLHYDRCLNEEGYLGNDFESFMFTSAQTYVRNNIENIVNRCKTVLPQPTLSPKDTILQNRTIEATDDDDFRISTAVSPGTASSVPLTQRNLNLHNANQPQKLIRNTPRTGGFNDQKVVDEWDTGVVNNTENRNNRTSNLSNRLSRNQNDNEKSSQPYLRSPKTDSREILKQNSSNTNHRKSKSDSGSERGSETQPMVLDKPAYKMAVSHIEKPTVFWVQDLDQNALQKLTLIFAQCQSEGAHARKVQDPGKNLIYLTQFDSEWFRCKVMGSNPPRVLFIDYGNTEELENVYQISKDLRQHPYQAARVTSGRYQPVLQDEINVIPKDKHQDGTYFVHITKASDSDLEKTRKSGFQIDKNRMPIQSKPETPQPATFFTVPRAMATLQDGQKVLIFKEENRRFCLRTRECMQKILQIEEKLKSLPLDNPMANVKTGQLVVLKNPEGTHPLYRAIIKDTSNNKFKVHSLDYNYDEEVSKDSVFPITEELSKEPLTYFISSVLQGFDKAEFNEDARTQITNFIESRKKFDVIFDGLEFNLKTGEGQLVSDLLTPRITEEPSSESVVNRGDRVMIADLPSIVPKLGLDQYVVYSFINSENLTLLPINELGDRITAIMTTDVDGDPYTPIVDEVVMGFQDLEDNWFRCVVESKNENSFIVRFLDFGDSAELTSDTIRTLNKEQREAPILGLRGKVIGVTKTRKSEEKMKKFFCDGEEYEADIKRVVNGICEVEFPRLLPLLKD